MKKERKYYRVKVHRYPPFYSINNDYMMEEDMYAYSTDGVYRYFDKYNRKVYGDNVPEEVKEISKEEFRGHHTRIHLEEVTT